METGQGKVIIDLKALSKQLGSYQKRWFKRLTHVSRNLDTGYAFEGDWLRPDLNEVPVGSLVLNYDEGDFPNNARPIVRVFRVEPNGALTQLFEWTGEKYQKTWALATRDAIAKIFEENAAAQREQLEQAAKESKDKRVELLKFFNDLLEMTADGREKYFKILKRSESSILFDICQMIQIMIRDYEQKEVRY